MMIFGSYLDHSRSVTGEAINITILDTFVALTAGFIIIPACFSYGIQPDAGPSLIFITLPNIFAKMSGGALWGFKYLVVSDCGAVTDFWENHKVSSNARNAAAKGVLAGTDVECG